MAIETTKVIKVFFSYAHEDKKLREELDKHLGALKRSGLIVTWYDRAIQAGMPWEDEIHSRLNSADLVLLLISHHFIDSDYCYSLEMHRALERHDAGEARVIPIILSPVLWEDTPISRLQALPRDGRSITECRNRNAAFMKVVQDIREVVKTSLNQQEAEHKVIQKQHHQTIDTHEAVSLFHQLMKADEERQFRVMYLIGAAHMGKSHLLTKVFPAFAEYEYKAQYVVFDIRRNPVDSVSDILNMISKQLGAEHCNNYHKAIQEMTSHSKGTGNLTHVLTDFASFSTSNALLNDIHIREERLTTQILLDLSTLNDKPLVLFFDTVNQASDQMQLWLIKTFLTKLSLLPHVRIVVAGRTLPAAPSDYMDLLQVHQLDTVQEEEEYITYCQGLNAPVADQVVRSLARECNYTPGLFASLFATFVQQGA